MPILKPFDIKQEFPNYFYQIYEQLLKQGTDTHKAPFSVVEGLLSANLQTILKRLSLVYVNDDGKLATKHFFHELEKKMKDCLPAEQQNSLEIYISGGVVRTLLAYIYKELHTARQNREVNIDRANEQRTKAKELQRQSRYLQIRNRLVEHFKQAKGAPLDIDLVCNELVGTHQNERDIVKPLYHYLAEHLSEITPIDLNSKTDNGLYHAFLLLDNPTYHAVHSELWQAMDSAEYHLLRSYMMEHSPLSQAFVLGVGSDLDILYELTGELSNNVVLESTIERTAKNFINSAETYFKLRHSDNPFKHSLIPVGDVKEYKKQIKRVIEQGGSMLDALAFKISSTTTGVISRNNAFFREPQKTLEATPIPIVKHFIKGIYDYISTGKATQKQTIRGLRALLELPFLELTEQGRHVIMSELNIIKKNVQGGTLDPDAMKQLEKMIRNAYFSGGHNRAYREPEDTPLRLFLEIVNNMTPAEATKIRKAFPKFLDELNSGDINGEYHKEVTNLLTTTDEFIKNNTAKGILYHGTNSENLLPILRGGFLISDSDQGTAALGSGLYTTNNKGIARDYARDQGQIIEININPSKNLRILEIEKIPKDLISLLASEAQKNSCDFNQLLREKYAIDIIISTHVVVQNLKAILLPNDFSPIIKLLASRFENLEYSSESFWDEFSKYDSFYYLAKYCGCPLEGIRTPDDIFKLFCDSPQFQGNTILQKVINEKKLDKIIYLLNIKKANLNVAPIDTDYLLEIISSLAPEQRLDVLNKAEQNGSGKTVLYNAIFGFGCSSIHGNKSDLILIFLALLPPEHRLEALNIRNNHWHRLLLEDPNKFKAVLEMLPINQRIKMLQLEDDFGRPLLDTIIKKLEPFNVFLATLPETERFEVLNEKIQKSYTVLSTLLARHNSHFLNVFLELLPINKNVDLPLKETLLRYFSDRSTRMNKLKFNISRINDDFPEKDEWNAEISALENEIKELTSFFKGEALNERILREGEVGKIIETYLNQTSTMPTDVSSPDKSLGHPDVQQKIKTLLNGARRADDAADMSQSNNPQ